MYIYRIVCRAPTRPSRWCDHAWRNEQFYRYKRDYEASVFSRRLGGGQSKAEQREREREKGRKAAVFSRGWRRRRDITRVVYRNAFTGPVERRPRVIHESRVSARRTPSVCSLLSYCIVNVARKREKD